jgi:hypothetical protein
MFFSLMGASCNVFYSVHSHIDENGKMIVHAHPYQKQSQPGSTVPNHSHTKSEFAFLALIYQALTQFTFYLFAINFLLNFNGDLISKFFIQCNPTVLFFKNIFRRGPPSFARFI